MRLDVGRHSRILDEWRHMTSPWGEMFWFTHHPKHEVTVSWLLAPFIFNPYQFRPSCWINDIKALCCFRFPWHLLLKKATEKAWQSAGVKCRLCKARGIPWFPLFSIAILAIFSPGIWKAWMRFFLEDSGMHWKRLCLELWHHVGSWYLDVMEGGYFTIVFYWLFSSCMASIFADNMIHEAFFGWYYHIHLYIVHVCVCVHVSWDVHLSLWSSTLRKMRWKQVLPTLKIKHPTMTLSSH